jgi:NAD(P)-dependent dehydrogenase (short-subunit alcohol dehydrogenase family)
MHIFVTGATGVLGKAVVPGLRAFGHVVYALSRSEAKRGVLQGLGAEPIRADLFDEEALVQALAGCKEIAGRNTKWGTQEHELRYPCQRASGRVLANLVGGSLDHPRGVWHHLADRSRQRSGGSVWYPAQTAPFGCHAALPGG